MKAYTDLEQSKKLAKILPIESADMRYGCIAPYDYSDRMYDGGYDEIPYPKDFLIKNPNFSANEYDAELPCWSLAALLEVIREKVGYDLSVWDEGYNIDIYNLESGKVMAELYSNPVDAVVETIYKLKEKNLI